VSELLEQLLACMMNDLCILLVLKVILNFCIQISSDQTEKRVDESSGLLVNVKRSNSSNNVMTSSSIQLTRVTTSNVQCVHNMLAFIFLSELYIASIYKAVFRYTQSQL